MTQQTRRSAAKARTIATPLAYTPVTTLAVTEPRIMWGAVREDGRIDVGTLTNDRASAENGMNECNRRDAKAIAKGTMTAYARVLCIELREIEAAA